MTRAPASRGRRSAKRTRMSVTRLYPSGRHRMFRFAAALVVLGLVAAWRPRANETMTTKGTVKTVAADSLTITDSAGKDWTFKVDTNTKVVASGGSHKTADTKAMGKTPANTDEVKAGAKVSVKYHDMAAQGMHAAEVRVL